MSIIELTTGVPMPVFGDPRRVSVELHDHLQQLIYSNTFAPGSIINQARLARAFGVSRTPMREAFRMLQEEGLIEVEVDQRAKVRKLDSNELDQLYGVRIALESLGARITAGRLTEFEFGEANSLLVRMEGATAHGDVEAWMELHRSFHELCVARSDEPLLRVINSYARRSERYLRLAQLLHPQEFSGAHGEHVDILGAIMKGDSAQAGTRIATHLAHTSLTVLKDVSVRASGLATREALRMANDPRP